MKFFLIILCSNLIFIGNMMSQDSLLNIIPEPYQVELKQKNYTINREVTIILHDSFSEGMLEAQRIKRIFEEQIGIKAQIIVGNINQAKNQVWIIKDDKIENQEGYLLDIDETGITFRASSRKGLFYASQTFKQLFPVSLENKKSNVLPYMTIKDFPRFPYRALMLDPARYFLPFDDIKKYISTMALYKFNKLHLHLTDDQGWRIEIKKYPKLTEIGSWRRETESDGKKHGGFYSQKQLKELVAYAKEHFVDIIPEIDMPGHSMAVLASYPELACFPDTFEVRTTWGVEKTLMCASNNKVLKFYDDVFNELATIFPYPEIHIGGDEAPTDKWETCPKCQNMINTKNLKNEHELMSHLFNKINKILAKYNKKPMLWYEESVSFYPKKSTVYLWRLGTSKRVIQATRNKGLKLICSPGEYAYFDYPESKADKMYASDWMPILTLKEVYNFDPGYGLSADEQKHIIGVEGCIWGETVKNIDMAFYKTYPRALALSEAGWSVMKKRSWENFSRKINKNLMFLLRRGVNFRPTIELSKKKSNRAKDYQR